MIIQTIRILAERGIRIENPKVRLKSLTLFVFGQLEMSFNKVGDILWIKMRFLSHFKAILFLID